MLASQNVGNEKIDGNVPNILMWGRGGPNGGRDPEKWMKASDLGRLDFRGLACVAARKWVAFPRDP